MHKGLRPKHVSKSAGVAWRGCFIRAWLAGLSAAACAAALGAGAAPVVPLDWQAATDIASGRGERGPWRQNESRYDYVDDPAAAIDERGAVAVVWVDQRSKDVFFRRIAAGAHAQHGTAVNVSRSPATFSWLPRIAYAPDAPQQVFVLWQEIIFSGGSHGGDILFARSQDGGQTFSNPLNLSDSIGGDGKGRINKDVWHNGSFALVAAGNGAIHVAWTEYDGPLWFSRSTDGGAHFSPPQRVAGDAGNPARAPALAAGPGRAVHLAWTTGEDRTADIHVARSDDGGASFSAPQIVAPSNTYSDAPKLAVDGSGVLHLVYAESAGGPFDRYRIRYARAAGTGFDAPRDISAPLPPGASSAAFPDLALDAQDRLYVLWELYPDHRQRPRGLVLTISADGGRSFAAPQRVPHSADPNGGTNGSHQGLLMKKLAVSRAGMVAIVNSSLRQGKDSRVWLMRARTK